MKIVDVDTVVVKQIDRVLCSNHFLLFVIYTQVLADFDIVDS